MKILFIAPVKSQARYYKRIMALKELGADCKILYFQRDYYEGKPWPITHKSLGTIKHGHYYSRIIEILKTIPSLKSEIKDEDVLYAFGLDVLLLVIIASFLNGGSHKIVYEVADLGVRTKKTPSASLITFIEKKAIRFVDKIILTSQGYYEGYFKKITEINHFNISIIENKIDLAILNFNKEDFKKKTSNSKLKIGYFGIIRSEISLNILEKLAREQKDKVKIIIAGKFIDGLAEQFKLNNIENIEYIGTYTSPDDLPMLYNKIDISWIVNDHRNAKYMRTNRFYEACFFGIPLITQKDSYDGKMVEKLNIGLNIDLTNIEQSITEIKKITSDDMVHWKQKLNELPPDIYTYNDEHEKLFAELQ